MDYFSSPVGLESLLKIGSSLAVIAGVFFALIQLRLNSRQARSRNAFDLISRVVDPSFAARRHRLYQVSKNCSNGNWVGFDQSLEDFEVRNFANIYEQLGLLVIKGVIELEDVMQSLSAQVMADWSRFQPIRKHIMEESGKAFPALANNSAEIESIYWPHFKWLAERNREWLRQQTLTRAPGGRAAKPQAARATLLLPSSATMP